MQSAAEAVKTATRVLIVEDDRAVFGAIGQLLTHYGFEVVVATTLKDANARYLENPDLIVLDLMLPDGNGIELLEKIRLGNKPTRVFVLSANSQPEIDRKVRRLVPNKVFRKPFNFYEILAAAQEAFPVPQAGNDRILSFLD